jgi:DNA-binding Lrp family transcriptional regulator
MMLKVRVASPAALLELIERLRQIPGVEGTETSIVLKSLIDRPLTLPAPTPPARARERSRR